MRLVWSRVCCVLFGCLVVVGVLWCCGGGRVRLVLVWGLVFVFVIGVRGRVCALVGGFGVKGLVLVG